MFSHSVSAGETTYSLQHTVETRHKLLKQYETVEGLRYKFLLICTKLSLCLFFFVYPKLKEDNFILGNT